MWVHNMGLEDDRPWRRLQHEGWLLTQACSGMSSTNGLSVWFCCCAAETLKVFCTQLRCSCPLHCIYLHVDMCIKGECRMHSHHWQPTQARCCKHQQQTLLCSCAALLCMQQADSIRRHWPISSIRNMALSPPLTCSN